MITPAGIVPPKVSWEEGCLLIIKAFHNIPPDFNEWELKYWKVVCDLSLKIIEAESKKLGL